MRWTPEETAIVAAMFESGASCMEIATRLNRTEAAVYNRLYQLELMPLDEKKAASRRKRQASAIRYLQRVRDEEEAAREERAGGIPFEPTEAGPGSRGKVEAMAERARLGLPLWHCSDRQECGATIR